ncbi:hypothetical protein GCM10018952_29970 [Streptosporangium vulgare]
MEILELDRRVSDPPEEGRRHRHCQRHRHRWRTGLPAAGHPPRTRPAVDPVTDFGFVALGDSFTEGVGDPLPDGTFRGWADLVAADLDAPGFGYANLAIRGRRFDDVVAQQVEVAIAMSPSLVSIAAGGNDALWRGFDLTTMRDRFDQVVARLRASGADVLLFTFPDLSVRLPLPTCCGLASSR